MGVRGAGSNQPLAPSTWAHEHAERSHETAKGQDPPPLRVGDRRTDTLLAGPDPNPGSGLSPPIPVYGGLRNRGMRLTPPKPRTPCSPCR